jgi:hypothetical protein
MATPKHVQVIQQTRHGESGNLRKIRALDSIQSQELTYGVHGELFVLTSAPFFPGSRLYSRPQKRASVQTARLALG